MDLYTHACTLRIHTHSHAHTYTHTHIHTYTHTHIHTYTTAVAVSGTSWAPGCVHFPPLSSAGERPVVAEGSLPLETGGLGQTFVGEGEEWVRSARSTLVLFRPNIVQELNIYAEAAKQLIICSQCWNFDCIIWLQYKEKAEIIIDLILPN